MNKPNPQRDDTDVVQLPALELSLERVRTGRHDGRRSFVSYEHADDPAIALHEAIHERIFLTTPDGQIQSMLMSLSDGECPLPGATRRSISVSVGNLFRHSRHAHEVFATYLGIRALADDKQADGYRRLPDDYRGYYGVLADAIESSLRSRNLQFAFAWTLGQLVFASPLLARASGLDWSVEFGPLPNERNDDRLAALLAAVRSAGLATLAERLDREIPDATRGAGIPCWDLQADEQWKLNRRHILEMERLIGPIIHQWLARVSPLDVLSGAAIADAFAALRRRLQGVGLVSENPTDVLKRLGVQMSGLDAAEARTQADSLLLNPRRQRLPWGEEAVLDATFAVEGPADLAVVSPPVSDPEGEREWYFLFFRGFEHAQKWVGSRHSEEAILGWLRRRTERERAGLPVPTVCPLVVGVADLTEFRDQLMKVLRAVTYDVGGTLHGSVGRNICWYYTGDWLALLAQLADFGRIQTLTATPLWRDELDAAEADPLTLGGTWLKVLKLPDLPGIFCRSFSHWAAAALAEVDDQMLTSGRLDKFPSAESREDATLLATSSFMLATKLFPLL